jgi:hypothetical protein
MKPDRPLALVAAVVCTVLIAGACSASGGSSDATGTTDPTGNSLAVASGPGDFVLFDPLAGLSDLPGYRASLTTSFDGVTGSGPQEWQVTSTMVRVGEAAMQVTFEYDGVFAAVDPVYVAEFGGTVYYRDIDGVCTAHAGGGDGSTTAAFEPADELAGVVGAELIGERDVGGVAAVGYRFDERAVGLYGSALARGEVWVARDGGFVVEYVLEIDATDELFGDGVDGTMSWRYEMSGSDVPDQIEIPDDCPPGRVTGPKPQDASVVVDAPGILAYDTASTFDDVLDLYRAASAELGWVPTGDDATGEAGGLVTFDYGRFLVSVFAMAREEGGSSITILMTTEAAEDPGTGGATPQGTVSFEITGGHDASGTWEFVEQFSFFSGSWTMTFTDPENPLPDGSFLTIVLIPGAEDLSFSDGRITIFAQADACTFDIDRQDASGAAGTITCVGVNAAGAAGLIDLTISFDV